jgi:DnaJ-class molecular chaperone
MSRVLCPTCHGEGTIDDPRLRGALMSYWDGRHSWPQVQCETCMGAGWVQKNDGITTLTGD